MFVNCPYCKALITTDPGTDLPPAYCPHCDSSLRQKEQPEASSPHSAPFNYAVADWLIVPDFENTPDKPDLPLRTAPTTDTLEQAQAAPDPVVIESSETAADQDVAEAVETTLAPSEPDVDPAITDNAVPIPLPVPLILSKSTPSFARAARPLAGRLNKHATHLAIVGLSLLLVLQLLLADRARLARNPNWRPVVQALCAALPCKLPPWREPEAFTLLHREVRQHPSVPGALRISATFRNDARWSQPWPQLQLTLSDVEGRAVGERSFRSEEYLGGIPEQAELASGETTTIAMDIVEPSPRIVAFDFRFQ